jgi:hypothetical protein
MVVDGESTLHRVVREALSSAGRDVPVGVVDKLCRDVRDVLAAELQVSRAEALRGSGSEHYVEGLANGWDMARHHVLSPYQRYMQVEVPR